MRRAGSIASAVLFGGISAWAQAPMAGQTITRAALLANNISHDNEMYGTFGVYLRAKNIVPPPTENAIMGRGAPPAGRGRGGQ